MKFLTQYNLIWQQISVGSREKVETFFRCWVQTVAMATYISEIFHKQGWQQKTHTGKKSSEQIRGDKYLGDLEKQSTYRILLMDAVPDSIKLFKVISVDPVKPALIKENSSIIKDCWDPTTKDTSLSTVAFITANEPCTWDMSAMYWIQRQTKNQNRAFAH